MNAVLNNTQNTALTTAMLRDIAKKLPEVAFNPDWNNGTGYFNGAVNADVQHTATFKDEVGRTGIIIPLDMGANLVIFERFPGGDRICANVPLGYNKKLFDGQVGKYPTKNEDRNKEVATDGFTLANNGRWYEQEDFSDALICDLDTLLALN